MGGSAIIDGEYHSETNNFLICSFFVDGLEYSSSENYFQSVKANKKEDKEFVRKEGSTGMKAWNLGNSVEIRPDWDAIRVEVMYQGNKAKFEQNKSFIEELIKTKGIIVFKSSTNFWNYWNGKIMERLRAEFRDTEEDRKVAEEITGLMSKYREEKKNKNNC